MHSRRFPSGLSLSLLVVGFINGKGCTFQQVKAFSLQKSMSIPSKASLLFMDQAADGVDNMRVGDGMERPIVRAIEIASIVSGKLLSPLVLSLLNNGFPSDWGMFWSRSNGHLTNGQRVALALEELGPTYVKFGQALASRPDVIPQSLAYDLSSLQDNMRPFDTLVAKEIIRDELSSVMDQDSMKNFLESLTDAPVAAASVGQVYKGYVPEYGAVAVKVQRPGIRLLVERDAALLRTLAIWAESIPPLPTLGKTRGGRLIATELVDAVEEFMSRIIEELDYRNEALNVAAFASLYCRRIGTKPMCVVPDVLTKLCTDNVLVLEWVQGTKLTAVDSDGEGALAENAASLEIIRSGIFCTLSQLLETGVLHADPHGGNLLKVDGKHLAYLDFGLLSSVPTQVRDGLVCATVELVFSRDIEAVASLFGELQLLPSDVLDDPKERAALVESMEITMSECLIYSNSTDDNVVGTLVPTLKFDKLLDALARLVPRFRFQLPPYFINNARAMSTLEGIARSLDPNFNVLQMMYPFALNRLLTNPTNSPVVTRTLQNLIRSNSSGRIEGRRIFKILRDSALITGYSRRRVLQDVLKTKGGRRLVWGVAIEQMRYFFLLKRSGRIIRGSNERKKPPRFLKL